MCYELLPLEEVTSLFQLYTKVLCHHKFLLKYPKVTASLAGWNMQFLYLSSFFILWAVQIRFMYTLKYIMLEACFSDKSSGSL